MSRLTRLYNRERKAVTRVERKIERSLPFGRLLVTLIVFCLIIVTIVGVGVIGFEGSINLRKENLSIESGVKFRVDLPEPKQEVVNVVVDSGVYNFTFDNFTHYVSTVNFSIIPTTTTTINNFSVTEWWTNVNWTEFSGSNITFEPVPIPTKPISRHSGYPFLGVVFDDGVRYVKSGQDPGACGIRGSSINEGNKQ